MADERDEPEVVPDIETPRRLLDREDVLELLEVDRRAVAERELAIADLVRQPLEPRLVLRTQLACVEVERLAGGVVVVRVVHPARDRGIVVTEDRERGGLADQVAALVRRRAVADDVADADVLVDALRFECIQHRGHRFDVRVDVGENPDSHPVLDTT